MPTAELTYEEKMLVAERVLGSLEDCCKLLFPERFKFEFSEGHHKIFHALRNPAITRIVIAAPRGFGKSSIVQLAYPTQRILARDTAFIVPTSCTAAQAYLHSENLKRELISNPRIVNIFGSMESEMFGKEIWIANNPVGSRAGTMVLPRSYGQQVRGILHGNDRPDLPILDDIEDPESVLSDDQRYKRKEWLYGDVLGALDDSKPNKVLFIGTVLGEDSLLVNLLEDPGWHAIRLELCDDDCNSAWPQRYTREELLLKRDFYARQGLLDVFFREYRNMPQSPDGSPFQSRFFKYYDPPTIDKEFVQYVVLIDPAKSSGKNACDTAIVGVGIDAVHRRFYVEDLVAARLHPDETAVQACDMAQRLHAHQIGIEKTGSGEYALWPLENYIKMKGLGIELIGLNAKRGPSQYVPTGSSQHGKDSRIGAALVPVYRQGLVYHNQNHPLIGNLETQLLTFPRSKRKDLIDALAYMVGMMEEGERYFAPSYDINDTAIMRDASGLNPDAEDRALEALYGKKLNKNWRLTF